MKAYILTIFLLYNFITPAQTYFNMQVGTSTKHFCGALSVGQYLQGNVPLSVEGQIKFHISNLVKNPAFIGAQVLYPVKINDTWQIKPLAGGFYGVASTEHTNLNGFSYNAGFRLQNNFNDDQSYVLEYNYMRSKIPSNSNIHFITIGISGFF